MPLTFLATLLSGEASTRQSFFSTIIALSFWVGICLVIFAVIPMQIAIAHLVWLVNVMFFVGGILALYGASITSHAISISFHNALTKFLLRFCNFLILFLGIIVIILVSSGEISWMTYFYFGVHA